MSGKFKGARAIDSTNATGLMSLITRFLPKVGMVTILMNDYPKIKVALLAVLGLFGTISGTLETRPTFDPPPTSS